VICGLGFCSICKPKSPASRPNWQKLDTDDDEKEDTKWRNAYSISVNDGRNNEARKELLQKIAKRLDEYGTECKAFKCTALTFDRCTFAS
jgi:aspartate/glutamate racemase